MAFTIYGTQTGAGAQYTPTPMPAEYSVPIGQPLPNRPITPESMDVNGNGGQTVATQGLPDDFFGLLLLMMGL